MTVEWNTDTDAEFDKFLRDWAAQIYRDEPLQVPKPSVFSELLASVVVWSIVCTIVVAGSYSAYRLIVWAVEGFVNHWFKL